MKTREGPQKKFVISDQDGIDIRIDVNGKVSIGCSEKAIYGRFWCKGDIRWRMRWMTLKGGETIT